MSLEIIVKLFCGVARKIKRKSKKNSSKYLTVEITQVWLCGLGRVTLKIQCVRPKNGHISVILWWLAENIMVRENSLDNGSKQSW